jgi:hypothetical protein
VLIVAVFDGAGDGCGQNGGFGLSGASEYVVQISVTHERSSGIMNRNPGDGRIRVITDCGYSCGHAIAALIATDDQMDFIGPG